MQLTVRSSLPGGTYHGRVEVLVYQCLRPVNSDDSRNSNTMKRMRKVFILLQHSHNNCVQTNLKFKWVWFQVFDTAVVFGGRGVVWGGRGGACCCLGGGLFGEEGGGLFFSFHFFPPQVFIVFVLWCFASFFFFSLKGLLFFQRRKVGGGGEGSMVGSLHRLHSESSAPMHKPPSRSLSYPFLQPRATSLNRTRLPHPFATDRNGYDPQPAGSRGWKSPTHAWKYPLHLSDETVNQGPPPPPPYVYTCKNITYAC